MSKCLIERYLNLNKSEYHEMTKITLTAAAYNEPTEPFKKEKCCKSNWECHYHHPRLQVATILSMQWPNINSDTARFAQT